jgi:Skp family chaperone for outer membrane proteins
MIMKKLVTGAAAAALMLSAAATAHAQKKSAATAAHTTAAATPAAAPNATPLTHGAPIPGVCVYSQARVLGISLVGKAFQTRMDQLRAQASAELSGEQTSLQNDAKALQGKSPTPDQLRPLQQREQALQAKADQRQRELQATYAHQLQRIAEQIEPVVRTAYEGHHCAVLLNGEAVMAANPAMDLSDGVISGLNAKMTTITFDREAAPAQ